MLTTIIFLLVSVLALAGWCAYQQLQIRSLLSVKNLTEQQDLMEEILHRLLKTYDDGELHVDIRQRLLRAALRPDKVENRKLLLDMESQYATGNSRVILQTAWVFHQNHVEAGINMLAYSEATEK